MTGKEKCNLMRQIRKKIAQANDIIYLSAECDNDGYCLGACPMCDAEIRYLDEQLNQKVRNGSEIQVAGIGMELLDLAMENQKEVVEPKISYSIEEKGKEEKQKIEDWKSIRVEDFGLSVRTCNCLKRAGISVLGELFKPKREDMMGVKNLGRKSLDEVLEKLKEMGIKMNEEDE